MMRREFLITCCFPIVLLLVGLASGPLVSPPRPEGWPSVAPAEVMSGEATMQVTRTMILDLPADADTVFPLFGPVRESEWSPGWKPAFIAPVPAVQSQDGAVFTTGDHEAPTVWVMTDYDPGMRIVRYVHLQAGQLVAQLWIRVSGASAHASKAEVTYRCTVVGPAGREALDHFTDAFPMFKQHWERAISAALAHQTGGTHPAHP